MEDSAPSVSELRAPCSPASAVCFAPRQVVVLGGACGARALARSGRDVRREFAGQAQHAVRAAGTGRSTGAQRCSLPAQPARRNEWQTRRFGGACGAMYHRAACQGLSTDALQHLNGRCSAALQQIPLQCAGMAGRMCTLSGRAILLERAERVRVRDQALVCHALIVLDDLCCDELAMPNGPVHCAIRTRPQLLQ